MMKAAQEYFEAAGKKVWQAEIAHERENFEEYFTSESNDGICCIWIVDDMDSFKGKDLDPKYNSFVLNSNAFNTMYLVILKSAIKNKQTVTLKVPSYCVGMVIGKGGARAKMLAQELGVRYVKIESYEEN